MTCREMLMQKHPEKAEQFLRNDGYKACPWHYNYMGIPSWCDLEQTGYRCAECWDREIPGTDKLKEENELLSAKTVKLQAQMNGDAIIKAAVIKDSGDRTQFESGAVRDMREGKGRCDLMPLEVVGACYLRFVGGDEYNEAEARVFYCIADFQKTGDTTYLLKALDSFQAYKEWSTMFLEVAKHFEEGAKKYGENNWQKGIPVHCYIDSAVRHYLKWLRGDDDEPHDRAFVWNLMCCIWEVDYREKLHE